MTEVIPNRRPTIREVGTGSVIGFVDFIRFREKQYWMAIHVRPVSTKMAQTIADVIKGLWPGNIATNAMQGGIRHTKTTQPLNVPGMDGQLSVTVEAGGSPGPLGGVLVPRGCGFHFIVKYHSESESGASTKKETASDKVAVCSDPSPDLVVAKGTLALHNSKMGMAGPTIDKIEVAEEWQGKGIGSALLRYMEVTGCEAMPRGCYIDFESFGVLLQVANIQSEKGIDWFVAKGYGPRYVEMSKSPFDVLMCTLLSRQGPTTGSEEPDSAD
ncbi:hypothetical protein KIPB_006295 [Kipferlia bialata]|uniref:Uncharacterized protein n=1 Tax=Kipferlia bialata TaxID=797122 RepID=A0A9K3CWU4_9EUKA|nr:hypothetical protein KIPB_006295 [Kipferlia bialata]|eukprot:g6295.t1